MIILTTQVFKGNLSLLGTNELHRTYAYQTLTADTKSKVKSLDKEYGARFSVLFELPYYNTICFAVIDPMHNLFLGTEEHMMCIWKDRGLLPQTFLRYKIEFSKLMFHMTAEYHTKLNQE